LTNSKIITALRVRDSVRQPSIRRTPMPDHVYRIIEVAGSSEKSIEDAIQNAVGRASRTLRQVGWFEVVQTRGHVEEGKVAHYQVILKVGFTLEDC
jgi:dodecin